MPGPVLSAKTETAVSRSIAIARPEDMKNLRMFAPPMNEPDLSAGNLSAVYQHCPRVVKGQKFSPA